MIYYCIYRGGGVPVSVATKQFYVVDHSNYMCNTTYVIHPAVCRLVDHIF